MSFDVASELKAEISKENDRDRRTLLMLMLGVLEVNAAGIAEIGGKIDELMADEKTLRGIVLNGHENVHHLHHEWVATQMVNGEAIGIERAWVRERMNSDCSTGCEWATLKMHEEEEAAKTAVEDAKADKRAARDSLIRTIVASVTSAAVSAVGVLFYLK